MKSVPEFRAKVEKAARRVIEIKLNYFKSANAVPLYPDMTKIDELIPDKDGNDFFVEQACRSITVYKKGELPYSPDSNQRVLLAGSEPSFFSEMKRYYKNTIDIKMSYNLGPNEAQYAGNLILNRAENFDVVFICVWNEHSVKTAEMLKPLQKKDKKIVVFSIMSPVLAFDLSWADTVLFGYSYSPFSFAALSAVSAGQIDCQGILPFSVEQ